MARKQTPLNLTLDDLLPDCLLSLEAQNMSPETVLLYQRAVGGFRDWLARERSIEVDAITPNDIRGWLRNLYSEPSERTGKPLSATTVDIRYRTLRAFWNWAKAAGYVDESPMAGVAAPRVPTAPKPHFEESELAALLAACRGASFEAVRDTAIFRFFMSTGCRLGEVSGLGVADVDIPHRRAMVTGKGARSRIVRLPPRCAQAMHRYIVLRARHPFAASSRFWLGERGPLTIGGVRLVVRRRAEQAGVDGCNPHKFRHTYAHTWRKAGGSVVDLEILMGWAPNSPMSRHYGATAMAEVALEHADEIGIGESL